MLLSEKPGFRLHAGDVVLIKARVTYPQKDHDTSIFLAGESGRSVIVDRDDVYELLRPALRVGDHVYDDGEGCTGVILFVPPAPDDHLALVKFGERHVALRPMGGLDPVRAPVPLNQQDAPEPVPVPIEAHPVATSLEGSET